MSSEKTCLDLITDWKGRSIGDLKPADAFAGVWAGAANSPHDSSLFLGWLRDICAMADPSRAIRESVPPEQAQRLGVERGLFR